MASGFVIGSVVLLAPAACSNWNLTLEAERMRGREKQTC